MDNQLTQEEQLSQEENALIAQITEKIKASCEESKYSQVCNRIKTDNGLAYVVNRCIVMMSRDNLKLSMALASLESEFEGVN